MMMYIHLSSMSYRTSIVLERDQWLLLSNLNRTTYDPEIITLKSSRFVDEMSNSYEEEPLTLYTRLRGGHS